MNTLATTARHRQMYELKGIVLEALSEATRSHLMMLATLQGGIICTLVESNLSLDNS